MATRTWNSSSSTDLNNGANYTGSGALLVTDDLVFDNTSVVNAAATANINVKSITISSSFTGVWIFTGFTVTVDTQFSDNAVNRRYWGTSITVNGAAGSFYYSPADDTGTSDTVVVMNGTTGMTFTDNGGGSRITWIKQLVLGPGAIVYKVYSTTTVLENITFMDGGTLSGTGKFEIRTIRFSEIITINGAMPTISVSSISCLYWNTFTVSIPAITMTSNFSIVRGGGADCTFNMNGNFSCGDLDINNTSIYGPNVTRFNTNNYNLTCANLTFGGNLSTIYSILNMGSSIVTVTGSVDTNPTGATSTVNMGTSQWFVKGNFTARTNVTYNVGTSVITLNGTNAANISDSPYTKEIPRIILNKSANVNITNSTGFTCKGLSTASSNVGTLVFSGYSIWSNGDFLYDYGNISQSGVLNAMIYMTVLNSTFRISTTGSVNTQYLYFSLQNSIVFDPTNSGNRTIDRLIVTAGKTITWVPNANKLTVSIYTAGDYSGTSGNVLTWTSQTPGTQYKVSLPAATVEYLNVTDCDNSGTTVNATSGTNVNGGNDVGFDFGAPSWISTYPKMDVVGGTSAGFKVKIDQNGTAYFVVLANGASAPTSQQVKDGQDASSTLVATGFSGSVALVANIEKSFFSFNLSLNTDYDVYLVAEKPSALQAAPVKLDFKTLVADGLGVAIHVYGASWKGSTWLSDPTAALTAVNDAFDMVNYLEFSGIQILSSLTSSGTGMAFAVTEPLYKKRRYIDPDQIGNLRAEIMSSLNTIGPNFGYSDVVLGTNAQS